MAVGQALLVVAEQGVRVADVVEHERLAGPVPGELEQVVGAQRVLERVTRALPLAGQHGHAGQDDGLVGRVIDQLELAQCLPEQVVGLIDAAGHLA